MKILRRIPIAIAFISAMVTVAFSATDVTTLEATPHKLVLLLHWGSEPTTREEFEEVIRLGAEHCKEFGKVVGKKLASMNLYSGAGEFTFLCVDKNKPRTDKNKLKTRDAPTAGELGEAITLRDKETLTLRDKPDDYLCRSLPYGNPDFAKEAERRELSEKKCKEILGQ